MTRKKKKRWWGGRSSRSLRKEGAAGKDVYFHGFSEEEVRFSLEEGMDHRRSSSLENLPEAYMLFESQFLVPSKKKKKNSPTASSSSSPSSALSGPILEDSTSKKKNHINIFTDNIIISGKRRWKPTEKAQGARSGFGLISKRSKENSEKSKEIPAHLSNRPKSQVSTTTSTPTTSVIKKKDILHLDEKALEVLQHPREQVKFYTDIQRSMLVDELPPPKLVEKEGSVPVNPAGAALIPSEEGRSKRRDRFRKKKRKAAVAGNIVCGICGTISFFKSIFDSKKMGTFSCDQCRQFICSLIRTVSDSDIGNVAMKKCVHNSGFCIIPPEEESSDKIRCKACWLKLCLMGYHLESSLHKQLSSLLPKNFALLEKSALVSSSAPHRGEILAIQNGSRLSEPLFRGFGSFSEVRPRKDQKESPDLKVAKDHSFSHIVNHRLPSNWYKKSSKILSGERKGEWDVHLITPDQKVLKNDAELKLYVAKTGSIIDSNVVNFSLPQTTLTNDKKISTIDRCQSKILSSDCLEVEDEIFCNDAGLSGIQNSLLSSTIKVPAKRKSSSDEKESSNSFPQSPKVPKADANLTDSVTSSSSLKSESSENSPFFAKKSACFSSNVSCEEANSSSLTPVFAKKSSVAISESKALSPSSTEVFAKKSAAPLSPPHPDTMKMHNSKKKDAIRKKPSILVSDEKKNVLSDSTVEPSIHGEMNDPSSNSLAINRNRRREKKVPLKYRDSETIPNKGSLDISCIDKTLSKKDESQSSYPVEEPCMKNKVSSSFLPAERKETFSSSSLMAKISTFKDATRHNVGMNTTSLVIKPIETKGKPKLSYSALIAIALFNLPGQRGTLSMLYEYIMEKFPYYKTVDKSGWQNSIRHNLSLNKCFVRTERTNKDGNGKGSFWIFDPEKVKNGAIKNFEKLVDSEELFIESESLKENLDICSESTGQLSEIEEELELSSHQSMVYRDLIHNEFEVKESKNTSKKVVMGSMDHWEPPFDLEKVTKNGVGILSNTMLPNEALCFLCGSAGKNSVFIHCCVCCEPFHPFCVDPGDAPNTEDEDEWVCRRCAVCQTCGQPDGKQLKCKYCRHAYHETCLQDYQRKFLKEGHPWVCSHCLKCDSCGKTDVAHYSDGVPLCSFCCQQRKKGSFCPLCKECYDDEDYDSRMMECSRCGSWVHARCENLDIEKYEVLSSLPSNIEYVCKCDTPILSKKKLLKKNKKSHLVRNEEHEEEQTLLTLHSLAPSSSSRLSFDKPWAKIPHGNIEEYFESPHSNIEEELPKVLLLPQDEFSQEKF